jgi:hypothetical protein
VSARSRIERLAPYKWRLVGLALGFLTYLGLWVVAIAGSPALAAVLITLPVLVFLIAAGNGLQHWLGISHRAPQFARPVRPDDEPTGPDPLP